MLEIKEELEGLKTLYKTSKKESPKLPTFGISFKVATNLVEENINVTKEKLIESNYTKNNDSEIDPEIDSEIYSYIDSEIDSDLDSEIDSEIDSKIDSEIGRFLSSIQYLSVNIIS